MDALFPVIDASDDASESRRLSGRVLVRLIEFSFTSSQGPAYSFRSAFHGFADDYFTLALEDDLVFQWPRFHEPAVEALAQAFSEAAESGKIMPLSPSSSYTSQRPSPGSGASSRSERSRPASVHAHERDTVLTVSKHTEFLGKVLVGPSALLTLVAGVVMITHSELSFDAFWVTWGFVGIVATLALGGGLSRRVQDELHALLSTDDPDTTRVNVLQKRLTLLNVITVLVLLSVVWAMVFKPTL